MGGLGSRMAEVLAGLSLATDLGRGFPPEKALRTTLTAARLAAALGLDPAQRTAVYYGALLHPMGCNAFAHDIATRLGTDELASMPAFVRADGARPGEVIAAVTASVRSAPHGRRLRAAVRNVTAGARFGAYVMRAHCEAAAAFAHRFGLGSEVGRVVYEVNERWDGKGGPAKINGEAIHIGARVIAVADQVEIAARTDGADAARRMVRRRAGGWFDPACVEAFERCAGDVLGELDGGSVWDAVLAAEEEPHAPLSARRVDDVAEGFADFVDLKSPYLLGHSRGVAALAEDAARRLGMSADDTTQVRRAALLHDLGRVAVSDLVWDRAGPLSASEWEQVRLHAYHTERVLQRAEILAPLASLAGMHHERSDGSGYHRGASAVSLPRAARILAAADAYRAMIEPRAYRPALPPERAVTEMEAMVSRGALDGEAAAAVCAAAGTAMTRPVAGRAGGLTPREIDVARLLARGRTKRDIAQALVIAPGTVHTHTARIYEKLGVSTRAAVALFVMEQGLLEP